uniref:Uncharacterized protein n=1 Tax=Vitrella brassicaformis TaxID=1169539 RepID=A0A6U4BM30_9ALVE
MDEVRELCARRPQYLSDIQRRSAVREVLSPQAAIPEEMLPILEGDRVSFGWFTSLLPRWTSLSSAAILLHINDPRPTVRTRLIDSLSRAAKVLEPSVAPAAAPVSAPLDYLRAPLGEDGLAYERECRSVGDENAMAEVVFQIIPEDLWSQKEWVGQKGESPCSVPVNVEAVLRVVRYTMVDSLRRVIREQMQYGYVVSSWLEPLGASYLLRLTVVSSTAPPSTLTAAIEQWLSTYEASDLTDEAIRSAVAECMSNRDMLGDREGPSRTAADALWRDVVYQPDRDERWCDVGSEVVSSRRASLESLLSDPARRRALVSQPRVAEFVQTFLSRKAPFRRKVTLQVSNPNVPPQQQQQQQQEEELQKEEAPLPVETPR